MIIYYYIILFLYIQDYTSLESPFCEHSRFLKMFLTITYNNINIMFILSTTLHLYIGTYLKLTKRIHILNIYIGNELGPEVIFKK